MKKAIQSLDSTYIQAFSSNNDTLHDANKLVPPFAFSHASAIPGSA